MSQPSVHQLYQRLETVGKGGYGSVHKGRHIPTGNIVALKIINLDTPDDDVADIQREVTLLSQLRDAPNVTKYYGCYMDGPRVWIVMEFAQGGSVDALMKASKDGCLEEKYASVITREVLAGLSYLHKVPVIHRDMKAANILITATGKVMICDFGVSALLATTTSKRNTLTGTPYWMAPEVVQSVAAYDTKADIWSLGIMVYEMIKGSPPHSNLDRFQVMELIPRIKPPRLSEHEGSREMRDFMTYCLKELPTERLPAEELLKTKWIKSIAKVNVIVLKDLIMRLKQVGPRASLAEPLDWEKEIEASDLPEDDDEWEFEPWRGHTAHRYSEIVHDSSTGPIGAEDQGYEQHTIRAPISTSAFPTSLRVLFEDNSNSQPQSYRPLPSTNLSHSSSSSGLAMTSNETLKMPVSLATSQEAAQFRNLNPPHIAATLVNQTTPTDRRDDTEPKVVTDSSQQDEVLNTPETEPAPSRTVQLSSPQVVSKVIVRPPMPSTREAAEPTKPSSASSKPLANRQRSRSSAESSERRFQDRDLASPAAFRFPSKAIGSIKGETGIGTPLSSKPSEPAILSSHQAAHSLDTPPRPTISQSLAPPPMHRARSATAIQPSRARSDSKTSTLVDEYAPELPKAPVRIYPDRNDSDIAFSSNHSLGTPGLKDVLKIPSLSSEHHLGFTDLLPPSPSAFNTHPHTNTTTGSSSSVEFRRSPSVTRMLSDDDVLALHSASPFPPSLPTKADYQADIKVPSSVAHFSDVSSLPPIKALDYTSLMNGSREEFHTEMAKTIESLAGWLSILEGGLSSIIDLPRNDVIEEEQEPIPIAEVSSRSGSTQDAASVWL